MECTKVCAPFSSPGEFGFVIKSIRKCLVIMIKIVKLLVCNIIVDFYSLLLHFLVTLVFFFSFPHFWKVLIIAAKHTELCFCHHLRACLDSSKKIKTQMSSFSWWHWGGCKLSYSAVSQKSCQKLELNLISQSWILNMMTSPPLVYLTCCQECSITSASYC